MFVLFPICSVIFVLSFSRLCLILRNVILLSQFCSHDSWWNMFVTHKICLFIRLSLKLSLCIDVKCRELISYILYVVAVSKSTITFYLTRWKPKFCFPFWMVLGLIMSLPYLQQSTHFYRPLPHFCFPVVIQMCRSTLSIFCSCSYLYWYKNTVQCFIFMCLTDLHWQKSTFLIKPVHIYLVHKKCYMWCSFFLKSLSTWM